MKFPDIQNFAAYVNRYVVGQPTTIQKSQHVQGVDPETGAYKFQDFDDNGSSNDFPEDYKTVTNISQKFFGGFSTSLNYKGWSLDISLQFVRQTGYGFAYNYTHAPGSLANQPTFVMDRWQKPGDIKPIQKFSTTLIGGDAAEANFAYTQSDASMVDASFVRLKNISLSWSLPKTENKKLHLQSTRIYAQAQNLLTFTNYYGLDPESYQSRYLPPLRMLTIGLQISI